MAEYSARTMKTNSITNRFMHVAGNGLQGHPCSPQVGGTMPSIANHISTDTLGTPISEDPMR